MTAKRAALILAVWVVAPGAASAQALLIHHSGRLLNPDDTPVDGTVALEFALFPLESGGTAVWSDATFDAVGVFKGFYHVLLGDTENGHAAITADKFSGDRWLALTINGQTLTPRLRIGTVPRAARAGAAEKSDDADKLGGFPAGDYLRSGTGGSIGNLTSTGTITATTFVGDLQGNADSADTAGTAQSAAFATSAGTAGALATTATGALPAGVTLAGPQVSGAVSNANQLGGLTADHYALAADLTSGLAGRENPLTFNEPLSRSNNSISLGTPAAGCAAGQLLARKSDGSGWECKTLTFDPAPIYAAFAGVRRPCNGGAGTQVFDGTNWGSCQDTAGYCSTSTNPGCSSATASTSCKTLRANASFTGGDGLYWITAGASAFEAYCDMTTAGGGWTRAMYITAPASSSCILGTAAFGDVRFPSACAKLSDTNINTLATERIFFTQADVQAKLFTKYTGVISTATNAYQTIGQVVNKESYAAVVAATPTLTPSYSGFRLFSQHNWYDTTNGAILGSRASSCRLSLEYIDANSTKYACCEPGPSGCAAPARVDAGPLVAFVR